MGNPPMDAVDLAVKLSLLAVAEDACTEDVSVVQEYSSCDAVPKCLGHVAIPRLPAPLNMRMPLTR